MRKDNWKPEDDLMLTETILDCLKRGETQVQAFAEAEKRLGRTASACGFRWNSEVRKGWEKDIKEAKEIGKALKKNKKQEPPFSTPSAELNSLQIVTNDIGDQSSKLLAAVNDFIEAFRRLQDECNGLQQENEELKRKLEERPQGDDLTALMKLMEHARKLGLTNNQNPAV